MSPPRPNPECGQAAVESALTLPLVVFLVLGTLQLFMMLQGRLMAQYAVYKAVRVGSVNQGSCLAMTHAAIAAVLPTIARTDSAQTLADAFSARRGNKYDKKLDGQHDGQIIEIVRLSPVNVTEEESNDQPDVNNKLRIRMLFWFRMKVPFANWVIGRMLLAHFGIRTYTNANPLLLAQSNADWTQQQATLAPSGYAWPSGPLEDQLAAWADRQQYLFPIMVSATMRMMTPPKVKFFATLACPLVPNDTEL